MHDNWLDLLNWPIAVCSLSIVPWLDELMHHIPGPTAIYAAVSALFMLFQMADKLGLLERFKRRPKPKHHRPEAERQ
jgi:hypothetical protein